MSAGVPPHGLSSAYMQWVKTHAHIQYNLAASGVTSYPLAQLPVALSDLEISGPSYYGYAPLQDALAKHCGTAPEQVFAAIGTSHANYIAMAALAEPGDEILLEDPTYELLVSTAQYLQLSVKRFPRTMENDYRIDVNDVERTVSPRTKLIIITNLHNPTNALTDERTVLHIGEIARGVGAKVLVDEVYLDSAFEQKPRSAIHLGKEFVVSSSLTKVYGLGGLRCGWVLAEPELVRKMWHINDIVINVPPHPSELLSVIALRNLDSIRAWSKKLIAENQSTLKEIFLARKDIECVAPGVGTIVFPRLKNSTIIEELNTRLLKHQTIVAPGKFFGSADHFRLGMGAKPEIFREGLSRLCRVLDEMK
ncbi:MAG: pyridoxal phosphate-dependent aminotransferase [Ignavibacteriae bacterium]|nr:pyridoxal phosphate-dependent aminotransferase [Ignavibacteriota bacterium]